MPETASVHKRTHLIWYSNTGLICMPLLTLRLGVPMYGSKIVRSFLPLTLLYQNIAFTILLTHGQVSNYGVGEQNTCPHHWNDGEKALGECPALGLLGYIPEEAGWGRCRVWEGIGLWWRGHTQVSNGLKPGVCGASHSSQESSCFSIQHCYLEMLI